MHKYKFSRTYCVSNPYCMLLQDSQLVAGVAFKKTFSYAGFEMQPKRYENPKIALLNIELELKAEKDNAEVRINNVEVRIGALRLVCY